MELIEQRYYNPTKLNNTTYLLMMFIEQYFGQEIFKGEGSRIFYGSDEFAFRQRLNKLYPTVSPPNTTISASQLQFPFCNYFRNTGWRIDTRPAIQNATAAIKGFNISNEIPIPVRFLQTEMDYDLTFYFDRDDDAQNCYDILMWIQNPTSKQFEYPGLMYKNYKLNIPIIMKTNSVIWTNQFKENEWLQKNRIIVVKANISIKSVVVDQYAAGNKSTLFSVMPESGTEEFYITKQSILDFLSYKNDPLINKENIVLDIIANFPVDPMLNAVVNVEEITETGAKVVWDYNDEALPLYEDNILIQFENGTQAYVPITEKEKICDNLEPQTTYNILVYFFGKNGTIIKKILTFETQLPENQLELKGMIGLEF